MRVKTKIITAVIILLIIIIFVPSCSSNEDKEAKTVYNQERFQFDNIFINRANRSIFEDKDYVYISSEFDDNYNLINNITRLNKITGTIEDLGVQGYNLTVYKNYLYYVYRGDLRKGEGYYLYRIDLNKLDGKPELVLNHVLIVNYCIANDFIYFYPAYPPPIFSMNLNDFSQTTDYYIVSPLSRHKL